MYEILSEVAKRNNFDQVKINVTTKSNCWTILFEIIKLITLKKKTSFDHFFALII